MKKVINSFCVLILLSTFVSAQSNIGIEASGGIKIHSGDLSDIWTPSMGGALSISYDLKDLTSSLAGFNVLLSAGYYVSNVNSTFNDNYSKLLGTKVEVDWPLQLIPISLGARYFFSDGKLKPYISAGMGLMLINTRKVSITSATGTVSNSSQDKSDSGLFFNTGGGLIYSISNNLGVDLNLAYENVSKKIVDPVTMSSSGFSFLSVNLGFVIKL